MRSPEIAHQGPAASSWTYYVGKAYLRLAGWTTEGDLPDNPKGILIAAPHTSGWDLPYMLAVAWVFRLKLRWIGKHTLFESWRGPFMRFLGGMPVDRRSRNGVVAQVVRYFDESDAMILAIAPEGTRGRGECWKSGFYHIAHGAKVPLLLGFLDFGRKVGGVGPAFIPTGNIAKDMDEIRAFYEGIQGLYPDKQSAICLREEREAAETRAAAE